MATPLGFRTWYQQGVNNPNFGVSQAETAFDPSRETISIDPETGRMYVDTRAPFKITEGGGFLPSFDDLKEFIPGATFLGAAALGANALGPTIGNTLAGLTGTAAGAAETGLAAELAAGAPTTAAEVGGASVGASAPAAAGSGSLGQIPSYAELAGGAPSMTGGSTLAELTNVAAGLPAGGVPATGIAALDAPGMVKNLAGGGLTGAVNWSGVMDAVSKVGPTAVSAVKALMDGGGSMSDLTKLLGAVAPAALGYFGAKDQQDSLAALGEKYFNVGAPSRARYEASFAPGFTMASDPGYKDALDQTTKATLYGLSPGGNPVGSPNAWAKTLEDVNAKFAYPALQNYRGINANTGGLASFTPAGISAEGASVKAGAGMYDAIGAGAADIFNPPKSLADLMREAGGYDANLAATMSADWRRRTGNDASNTLRSFV